MGEKETEGESGARRIVVQAEVGLVMYSTKWHFASCPEWHFCSERARWLCRRVDDEGEMAGSAFRTFRRHRAKRVG